MSKIFKLFIITFLIANMLANCAAFGMATVGLSRKDGDETVIRNNLKQLQDTEYLEDEMRVLMENQIVDINENNIDVGNSMSYFVGIGFLISLVLFFMTLGVGRQSK